MQLKNHKHLLRNKMLMMHEKNDISIMQRVIINEKNNEDLMKIIDS